MGTPLAWRVALPPDAKRVLVTAKWSGTGPGSVDLALRSPDYVACTALDQASGCEPRGVAYAAEGQGGTTTLEAEDLAEALAKGGRWRLSAIGNGIDLIKKTRGEQTSNINDLRMTPQAERAMKGPPAIPMTLKLK